MAIYMPIKTQELLHEKQSRGMLKAYRLHPCALSRLKKLNVKITSLFYVHAV